MLDSQYQTKQTNIGDDRTNMIILCAYAFILLFFCSKMSPLYPFNEWSDVNLYFNMGKSIFNGRVMYTEAFDHKGPLIFIIYGFGYLISNTSFVGIYIIESLAWACMIVAVYRTARLYRNKAFAFIVALAFPIMLLSHIGEGGSADEFITVCMCVSMYFFILYFEHTKLSTHKPMHMLIHGAMSAVALFIKLNLVVFWFFPLLAIFINILLNKEYKNLIKNILFYIIGLLIVAVPIFLYLLLNSALNEAWNVYILLNKGYAQIGGIGETMSSLAIKFYQRLRFDTIEFSIILLGAFYFPMRYIHNKWGRISIMLSFASLFILIFISSNYVHYYSIPYYVFGMLGLITIACFLRKYMALANVWYINIIFMAIAVCIGINRKDYFGLSSDILLRKEKPSALVDQFGAVISESNNPTLLNLGLDLGNGLFTKLDIMPNVKYFISPNLQYDVYPGMRNEQTNYIENKEVEFIILTNFGFNSDYFRQLPALQENYEAIDMYKEDNIKTYYLLKRKDTPSITQE